MQTLDKYQVLEKIGVGGFGVVYKAYDPFIKRHVAIKTCTSEETETRERFMREAEIAGNLHHRNIVTVYDFGFQEGVPYLVQEYLTGEDLDRKIKRREYLSLPEKLLYLVQIARGLQYAHSRGVVHRDIKPANIRILEDDTAKIMDFGIAKLAQQQETLTQEGITLGTAAYLAPEQIRGGAFDARTDLFSFGILAYELLAFERPFQGAEISAVFYKILNEAAPPLAEKAPDCPAELERIVQRCLEKDPQKRYANCTDLLHDIETLAHRRPGAAADPHATAQLTARTARAPQAAEPTTPPTPPTPPTTAMVPTIALPKAPPARAVSLGDIELDARHAVVQAGGDADTAHAFRKRPSAGRAFLKSLFLLALAAAAGWGGWRYWEESRPLPAPRSAAARAVPAASTIPPGVPETTADGAQAVELGEPPPATPSAPANTDSATGVDPSRGTPTGDSTASPGSPVDTADSSPTGAVMPAVEETAPPAPPPAPEPAVLTVAPAWDSAMSLRLGGKVWTLDRERRLELAAGSYKLKFAIDSPVYSHVEEVTVRLAEGESRRIASPIERPGKLTVQPHINARQAFVRLDGAPAVATPLRGRWLAPGPHIVEIVASPDAAAPVLQQESIEIRSESESILTFDLDGRSPQRLAEKPILPN